MNRLALLCLAALSAGLLVALTHQQAEKPCCGLTCQPYAETCPACKDCCDCRDKK